EADLSAIIGGAVKVFGKGAVHVRGHDGAVLSKGRHSAVVVDDVEDFLQDWLSRSANFNADIGRIGLVLADADVLQIKAPAVRQNFIEHFGQDEGVDDVSLDFDFLHGS